MEWMSELTIVMVCLVFSAFFSGSETALLRLANHEVEEEVRRMRGPAALAVRDLLGHTSRLLVTILLGNNLVNILGAATASAMAVRMLGEATGIVVATVTMTVVVLIFCEVLPKAAAARHPRRIAYLVGLPIYVIHQALRPLHLLFDRIIEPVVRRVGGDAESSSFGSSEAVLRMARGIRDSAPEGTPLAIIGAVAGAAEMTVEEIMVARTEIVAFPSTSDPAELLERVLEERYTRVPIYEGSIDRVLGVAHLKDLIELVRDREGSRGLVDILKPVLRVPGRKPILRLLAEMQRSFIHLALVKDEFGVTLGMVTQEDILEEIVGEIRDEFDLEELEAVARVSDDSFRSLGRVTVLDFNRATDWSVPAERGESLGGLVFHTLGRAPRRGEVVEFPGYEFTVEDVSGSRITRLRVRRLQEPPEGEEAKPAARPDLSEPPSDPERS
jgi:CBS domain containing-hemolysin-like protein